MTLETKTTFRWAMRLVQQAREELKTFRFRDAEASIELAGIRLQEVAEKEKING